MYRYNKYISIKQQYIVLENIADYTTISRQK